MAQCLTNEIEIISLYFKGLDLGIIQAKVEASAPSNFSNPDQIRTQFRLN